MKSAKLKDENGNVLLYNIPTSWDDITMDVALKHMNLRFNNADHIQILSNLTLIPEQVIGNMSEKAAQTLNGAMAFMEDEAIFFVKEPKNESRFKEFDFGSLPYKKAEKVRQLTDKNKSLIENCPPVFKYLFDVDLSQEPFTEWIGTVNFFLTKWGSSMIHLNNLKVKATRLSKNSQGLADSKDSNPLLLM